MVEVTCRVALALLALALGARGEGARCAPAKPSLSGMHELSMRLSGLPRRALLYVPPGYRADRGLPLVVVPQAFGWSAEFNIQHSKLMPLATEQNFSLVQLDAPGLAINVALDGRANPARPDDVAYTTAVLNEVDRVLCLDARRIFCVGFSRGARFCSRLASERSDIFAAIVALSGLRYPRPNNASRPVPVLTFHGTADTVNPYAGGGPPYWQSDMADAVSGWVGFNRCQKRRVLQLPGKQRVEKYSACREDAEVVFTTTEGGGHEWPDAQYPLSAYPPSAPSANALMLQFLMGHPLPVPMSTRHASEQRDAKVAATVVPPVRQRPRAVGENVAPLDGKKGLIDTWDHGIERLAEPSAAAAQRLLLPLFLLGSAGLLLARLLPWRAGGACTRRAAASGSLASAADGSARSLAESAGLLE